MKQTKTITEAKREQKKTKGIWGQPITNISTFSWGKNTEGKKKRQKRDDRKNIKTSFSLVVSFGSISRTDNQNHLLLRCKTPWCDVLITNTNRTIPEYRDKTLDKNTTLENYDVSIEYFEGGSFLSWRERRSDSSGDLRKRNLIKFEKLEGWIRRLHHVCGL